MKRTLPATNKERALRTRDPRSGGSVCGGRPGQRVGSQGTWAPRTRKRSEAGRGWPGEGVWGAKNRQTTSATTSTTPRRQLLGAADAQTAHPATSSTAPVHQPRGSASDQQEHRPQRPTESSDLKQHAKGRTGDCPGPRKETATRRNVTRGGGGGRGGERLMGTAACGGRGFKGRGAVSGERPIGAARCRQQHDRASCHCLWVGPTGFTRRPPPPTVTKPSPVRRARGAPSAVMHPPCPPPRPVRFQVIHPDHVHLNRGNHEDEYISTAYDFYDEVRMKYGGSLSCVPCRSAPRCLGRDEEARRQFYLCGTDFFCWGRQGTGFEGDRF